MGEDGAAAEAGRGGWWPEAALLLGALGVTALLVDGTLLGLDLAVRDWFAAHQAGPLRLAARGLNFAGSANLLAAVAVLLALPIVLQDRSARTLAVVTRPILLAFALSYGVVAPIKLWTDRAAPGDPSWDAVELFAHPEGWSFPSGHVVNAVIWYRILLFLMGTALEAQGRPRLGPRHRRLLRIGPPVVVCWTVTYLGYHWLTDTVVGVLLGLLLERVLRRLERRRGTARPFGTPRHVVRSQPAHLA